MSIGWDKAILLNRWRPPSQTNFCVICYWGVTLVIWWGFCPSFAWKKIQSQIESQAEPASYFQKRLNLWLNNSFCFWGENFIISVGGQIWDDHHGGVVIGKNFVVPASDVCVLRCSLVQYELIASSVNSWLFKNQPCIVDKINVCLSSVVCRLSSSSSRRSRLK